MLLVHRGIVPRSAWKDETPDQIRSFPEKKIAVAANALIDIEGAFNLSSHRR